ncbi:MAG TPA: SUMF1/EgtB/PvdO family nonheme iron enzyme, partial [Anaerolineaceae bacterium]|nr:SUMF1/EgtB/PvdO family nonheme iron enzyme [Anaerolineaceae bacterium]
PDVPAALDELVAGMLSEEPRRRPWDGAAAEKALQELSAAEPAAPAVSPIRSRTPATWSLEDGLSALKDMEEAQDWQLAAEQLAELEEAYPNHPKLKLPHKRITQALEDQAQAQREAEEKSKREAEAQARHEAEEKSKREAELRPGYLRRAGDHIFIRLDSAQEMAFVRIPAGEFLMGSDPEKDKQASANEQPQHLVSLPEYWMGQTPVTNAQYAAYIMAMKGKALSPWKNNQPPQDKLDHPVVHVSWKDAVAYCAWLSELTGRRVGLPTEAEWEKAARGTDGRIYPWGDQDPDEKRCNFDGQAGGTTPVGRYSPTGDSPYGCVDMAGNVWELCADWSDEFGALSLSFLLSNASKLGADRCDSNNDPKSTTTCPTCPIGPPIGDPRFMRGGAWFYDTDDVRAALRDWCPSDSCYSDVGFRCCLSAAP